MMMQTLNMKPRQLRISNKAGRAYYLVFQKKTSGNLNREEMHANVVSTLAWHSKPLGTFVVAKT